MKEIIKNQNRKAKGKIKIELFENGEKVKEHNDTNFISKGAYSIMDLYAYDLLFGYKSNGKPAYSSNILSVFSKLLLTDATHPESPETEFYPRGNLIGFGDSRVSSVDASNMLQGGYNVLESQQTRNRVRLVFDFGNNYGNGTFSSIYFANALNLYSVNSNTIFTPEGDSPYGNNDIKMLKVLNGMHYLLNINGTFNVYNENFELLETYNYPSAGQISDFEIVGDYVYFTSRSTSLSIRRARLDNLNDLQSVTIPNGISFSGITYSTKNNNFYVNSFSQMYVYDSQFSLLNTIPLKYNSNALYSAMTYLERTNEIVFNNSVYNIDDNDFGVWYTSFTGVNTDVSYNLCTGLFDDDNMYFSRNASVLPLATIGSRSLLDSPITKTSNQTMKITYDFIVE